MNRLEIIDRVSQQESLKAYWKQMQKTFGIKDNRVRKNVVYRHAFLVAAKEMSNLTLKDIGTIIERDHATVLHAKKVHDSNFRFDRNYSRAYKMICDDLSEILVTDIDEFTQQNSTQEVRELRNRLMKLARKYRDSIVENKRFKREAEESNQKVNKLRIELNEANKRNIELNKKLNYVAW